MASWDEVLNEVQKNPNNLDSLRKEYLKRLENYTKRNVIVYYSGWLGKPNVGNSDINDNDMNGFMTTVKGMDTSKGLDLVLHTPGGDPAAAEAIVNYLRKKFNKNIRIIVPQLAMSAGTMVACSAQIIIMGKHSSLGPIDPQINGIPAYCIKKEFEDAKREMKNNASDYLYWKTLLEKYPIAFLNITLDSIDLSAKLIREWLGSCMYNRAIKADRKKINKIVKNLNEHANSKTHSRHLDVDTCKKIGLKVENLEDDQELQDLVLSIHHIYNITISKTSTIKLIESSQHSMIFLVN